MKTMVNNLQKGIITAILVSIISTVGNAATKTRETPNATNKNSSEAVIAKTTAGTSAETAVNANEMELSDQIEDWMSNGSYWESDNSSELSKNDLAAEIESWMSNGSYWNTSHPAYKAVEPLAGKIKSWMKSGSYWGSDNE